MRFSSKQLRIVAQRFAALWLLLIVLSGIVPPVFASSTMDFCPLMTKSAPVFQQNPDDPICDIRIYLKQNQPPKKPKTWWQKFWSSDNFTANPTSGNSTEKQPPSISFQHDCCKLCCANISSSTNQNHAKSLTEITKAEIISVVGKTSVANSFSTKGKPKISFRQKSRPRAPPVFN